MRERERINLFIYDYANVHHFSFLNYLQGDVRMVHPQVIFK